jgi:hypothetical protein
MAALDRCMSVLLLPKLDSKPYWPTHQHDAVAHEVGLVKLDALVEPGRM